MKKEETARQLQSLVFFIGWALSPFTTWNDLLINIPLSYVIANFLRIFLQLPFKWLLVGSYVITNILGLALMFFSGKKYVLTEKNKMKGALSLVVNTVLLSIIVYLLDKSGILRL